MEFSLQVSQKELDEMHRKYRAFEGGEFASTIMNAGAYDAAEVVGNEAYLNAPFHTGELRNSIRWKEIVKATRKRSHLSSILTIHRLKAQFIHFGTRRIAPNPFLIRAATSTAVAQLNAYARGASRRFQQITVALRNAKTDGEINQIYIPRRSRTGRPKG